MENKALKSTLKDQSINEEEKRALKKEDEGKDWRSPTPRGERLERPRHDRKDRGHEEKEHEEDTNDYQDNQDNEDPDSF